MRYIIGRVLKNIPFINKIWASFMEFIDFKYYKKYCTGYKIIPFGNYCFPRVISTLNRFKPTKKYGEESFPLDLAFSDFAINTNLLSTHFKDFFTNIEYKEDGKYYINSELKLSFNHDHMPFPEFKERYQKRIDNLYNILQNQQLHLYFLIATFDPISEETIRQFLNEVNKFKQNNTYDLIIINQSKENIKSAYKNVHIIDLTKDTLFDKINKKGDWVGELKWMKSRNARKFNSIIKSKLSQIISIGYE